MVTLDNRNLRTPSGVKLVVPKNRKLLAILIANEWDNQDEVLKQHALAMVRWRLGRTDPETSLASRAVDGTSNPKLRQGVVDALMPYLETDTIW